MVTITKHALDRVKERVDSEITEKELAEIVIDMILNKKGIRLTNESFRKEPGIQAWVLFIKGEGYKVYWNKKYKSIITITSLGPQDEVEIVRKITKTNKQNEWKRRQNRIEYLLRKRELKDPKIEDWLEE